MPDTPRNPNALSAWPAEREQLRRLIYAAHTELSFDTVVELGSFQGATSAVLADAAATCGASLVCVDTWDHPPDGSDEGAHAAFLRNTAEARERGFIVPLRMTTLEAARHWRDHTKKAIGLVFIDADHAYPAPLLDLEAWYPLLAPGGVVALHDLFDNTWGGGVRRAVHEFLVKQPRGLTVYTQLYVPTEAEIAEYGHAQSGLCWWRKPPEAEGGAG